MKIVLVFFMVLSAALASCQEMELVRHTVGMGETVRMISRKYKVTPSEIYKYNKFAIDGVSKGMLLEIFVPKKETIVTEEIIDFSDANHIATHQETPEEEPTEITHLVESGETLYGIARKYNISVSELKEANAEVVKKGLAPGQILKVRTRSDFSE